ncbi:MAG: hypothetical protein ABI977_12000, partial [Acidobacteriota bacterium]
AQSQQRKRREMAEAVSLLSVIFPQPLSSALRCLSVLCASAVKVNCYLEYETGLTLITFYLAPPLSQR